MKENQKSWPQKGDKYYFVADDLGIASCTVTDMYSDAYEQQRARRMACNFFKTFEEAENMAKMVFVLFQLHSQTNRK